MRLSPTPPTPPSDGWRFSCQPIGAQLFACVGPWLAVFVVVGGVVLLTNSEHTFRAVIGIASAVVLPLALIRARRIGVWADADRVVVRNFWKTHEFDWIDVSRIGIRGFTMNATGTPGRYWIFRMHDGHGVISQALPFSAPKDKTHELAVTARTRVDFDGDPWASTARDSDRQGP
jgi:hypothetical protein